MATNPLDRGVYTVEKGPPPMPDEGPTKDSKPLKKYVTPKQKEDPLDKGVYTVEKGPPPMPDEGPTKDIKPPKKYAKGGSVSSRADGCAQRGKTRGMLR